jgi:ABC-2 type transport system permease protein
MSLLPGWAQRVADFLPFQWTFGFPIEALVGHLSTTSLLTGLAAQVFWIALGSALVSMCWRASVRRYSAVGN